jgi:DNA polymerase-3 subunit delta
MAKKENISHEELLVSFRKRDFKPIYFLMGEEPYFIDLLSDFLEKEVLTEDEKEFNQTIVYGKETNIDNIINLAKRYPMMSQYQLIVVKEAQHIKSYENLSFYLQNPQQSTILVFCYKYGTLDKRKKVVSNIAKVGVVFESKKLYENQIPSWIVAESKKIGLSVEIKAANMMAEFLGTDLERIKGEIKKLLIIAQQNQTNTITPDIVERNIGISKDYNVFELQKSLGKKDILMANQIVDYFKKNKKNNPIVVILPVLFNFFANVMIYHSLTDKSQYNVASVLKINPYFANDYAIAAQNYPKEKVLKIIHYIREADAQHKGIGNVSTDEGEILRLLVFKILH